MARGNRRGTYWLGALNELTLSGAGTTHSQLFLPAAFDEETPTLVGMIGKVFITAARTDVYTTLAADTEAGRFAVGISCQGASTSESIDLLTNAGLGDERLLWTDFTRIDATAHAYPYWDGSSPVEVIYGNVHTGNYPAVLTVSSRAMRKIEHPCTIASHLSWGSVTSLGSFASCRAFFMIRAIFKA